MVVFKKEDFLNSSLCLATSIHRCGQGRESDKGSWVPQRPSCRQLTDSPKKAWRRCLGPFGTPACLQEESLSYLEIWLTQRPGSVGIPWQNCFSSPSFGGTFCHRRLGWQVGPSTPTAVQNNCTPPPLGHDTQGSLLLSRLLLPSLHISRGQSPWRDEKEPCKMEQHRRG